MSDLVEKLDSLAKSGLNDNTLFIFTAGVEYTQERVAELMDEVIENYESKKPKDDCEIYNSEINALKFMRDWVSNGGE